MLIVIIISICCDNENHLDLLQFLISNLNYMMNIIFFYYMSTYLMLIEYLDLDIITIEIEIQ